MVTLANKNERKSVLQMNWKLTLKSEKKITF